MRLEKNFNIKDYNTFHLNVKASQWLSVKSVEELQEFVRTHSLKEQKHLVIGGGSNLLFLKDFGGLLIKIDIDTIRLIREDEHELIIKAGAGVVWDDFVAYTVDKNYWGVENLSHIPGTVGASPVQNIGAYGVEAKDSIYKVIAINKFTGELKEFNNNECEFAYRDSYFKKDHSWIVVEVEYLLSKRANPQISYNPLNSLFDLKTEIGTIRREIIKIRDSKLPDPDVIGNAGSFFKNPVVTKSQFLSIQNQYPDMPKYLLDNDLVKIPAAWLIDSAGWKGLKKGEVGVHENQALVLVNHGKASGQDVYSLSEEILQSVKEKFDINLEREVIVIS